MIQLTSLVGRTVVRRASALILGLVFCASAIQQTALASVYVDAQGNRIERIPSITLPNSIPPSLWKTLGVCHDPQYASGITSTASVDNPDAFAGPGTYCTSHSQYGVYLGHIESGPYECGNVLSRGYVGNPPYANAFQTVNCPVTDCPTGFGLGGGTYTRRDGFDPATSACTAALPPKTCPLAYPAWSLSADQQWCERPLGNSPKDMACSDPSSMQGNPIHVGIGNKYQPETDFRSLGNPAPRLDFVRYYNSGSLLAGPNMGAKWSHTYSAHIAFSQVGFDTVAQVSRPDGRAYQFNLVNGNWVTDPDVSATLIKLTNSTGDFTGWQYTTPADETELYDTSGRLKSITDRSGVKRTLKYYSGNLVAVTDSAGHSLSFGYDASNRMVQMTDPAGGVTTYAYDEASSIVLNGQPAGNNLTSVTYPGGSKRIYWYNEPANTGNTNLPNALTGISEVDSTGQITIRHATYQYDSQSRAIVTEHGPNLPGGPVEKYTLAYNTDGTTTVTDPLNTARTYGFTALLGVVKNTSLTQPCASCGGSGAQALSYDANGNVASRTDFNGNTACYAYDLSRNLETVRVEGLAPAKSCPADLAGYTPASGTVERKLSSQWHSTFHLPLKVAEPNRLTTYSYDTSGNLLSRTEQQTTDATGAQGLTPTLTGSPRTWTYTYVTSSQGLPGQVRTVDGPRTDVADVTTDAYYTDTTASHHPGDRMSVTNALGQVTTYDRYDGNGRLLQTTDPNGLVTTLTYTPRGWLQSKTRGSETTTYGYDFAGNLTSVQHPSGESYTYTYDDAHRLTDITDPDGNHLRYTLDGMGNRIQEQILDVSNNVLYTHSRTFDALNRLWKDIGAYNQTATYSYDSNGNLKTLDGPRTDVTDVTQNQYDALNRLIQSTAPDSGITKYGYNGLDQLTGVTDPNSLTTTYTLDAWGGQTQTASPDTGNTIRTYDTAGNLKTERDARGITTTWTYDALNRVLSKSSSDSATPAYTYAYDTPCGKGRLCTVQRNGAAHLSFTYDSQGRVASQQDSSSGATLTSQYAYDPQGRLAQITYPTGRSVTYGYDTRGRVSQVSTTYNGVTTILANAFVYQPFGPVKSYAFGNTKPYSIGLDQDYRIVQETSGPRVKTDTYDPAGNLSILLDPDTTQQRYGYDANNRLTGGNDTRQLGWGSLTWTYDPNGNRKSETRNGTATTYAYAAGTNRLASLTGGLSQSRSYDAMGNTRLINNSTFSYDGYGRMVSAPQVAFAYNALGERTRKTLGNTATRFHYGPDGQFLYEASGTTSKAYVWLDGRPLARIDNNTSIYYYHDDPLGTPQAMTDSAGTTVWKADYEPFGKALVRTQTIVNNLRLPGQYYDAETGLHYNYFRDYDPGTGRYVQSDPIGLTGGINTYTYVYDNPLAFTDRLGLAASCNCKYLSSISSPGKKKCNYRCDCQCNNSGSWRQIPAFTLTLSATQKSINPQDFGDLICPGQTFEGLTGWGGVQYTFAPLFIPSTDLPGIKGGEAANEIEKQCSTCKK